MHYIASEKVIGLANAGSDTTNAIKQASEFGLIQKGQKLAALLIFSEDVHSLGLDVAQGLVLTEPFYWDLNDGTRAFSRRFVSRPATQPCIREGFSMAMTLRISIPTIL